jgi:hypothetical protein
MSAPVRKSVRLELVLCRLRNAHVTEIGASASKKGFDDADATRIAEAWRCEILHMCLCDRITHAWRPKTIACVATFFYMLFVWSRLSLCVSWTSQSVLSALDALLIRVLMFHLCVFEYAVSVR